ncbi:MAG: phospholipid carrier-dependent glycosyltransferase [Clostridiales bacterium]|nr:phospholipid carrier-dependent glycosyltransferase [Clostridiales bacterium]
MEVDRIERFSGIGSKIRSKETLIALLIILMGALLRLLYIGSCPVGFNQDEASAGYEAWALLNYGMDRNGNSMPVLFVSWGSGQNVLYSYLSMPFIVLFGLSEFSVRLLSALAGSATLPVFYLLAKKIRGTGFGLTALVVLAFNPWHIMISRWALESNLLPFFLLLGIYFLIMSREKPAYMPLSALAFALSLYAYGTAFIFLPFFFILSFVYFIICRELRTKSFLCSLAVFLVVALPITLCNLINILELGERSFLGLTLPELTQTRQASTTVFGKYGFGQIIKNQSRFLKLLWTQDDGLPWNSVPGFGLFYGIAGLIPSAIGLFSCIHSMARKKGNKSESLILFAVVSAFIAAGLIDVNINRVNMAFLPIIYFQALGIWLIAAALGRNGIYAFLCVIALLCSLFAYNYFTGYQKTLSPHFFEGLGEAIKYAEGLDTEGIWITGEVNSPYIYVLFYNRIPPGEFIHSVEYTDPEAPFRPVSSFDKYRFGGDVPEGNYAYIIPATEAGPDKLRIIHRFGNYAVALP